MTTQEEKETNLILKQKACLRKQEREQENKIKLRQEFVVWTKRMREMYMDFCDSDDVEPTKEGFAEFLNDND